MTVDEAIRNLISEYQFLAAANIQIIKQFASPDGRISNTFLVESSYKGFEQFIAKSFVHHSESIEKEWTVLKLLENKKANAPRLLLPDKPKNFLLIEYIDGIIANEALAKGYDESEMFKKIGKTSGMVNAITLNVVGDILNPTNIGWKNYFLDRLNNGIKLAEQSLDSDLFNKLTLLIKENEYVLDDENKKKPHLVHHDMYLDNYLLSKSTNEIILIDYGIAFGGSPLFDLAKFYIWTLSKYPDKKSLFMKEYSKYVEIPLSFNKIMKMYVIKELLGMLDFFTKINDKRTRDESLDTLKDLINKQGVITRLLDE